MVPLQFFSHFPTNWSPPVFKQKIEGAPFEDFKLKKLKKIEKKNKK